MGQLPKRYIFADYESLKKVKFSKLQKVCNKVFIFINNQEQDIPFYLVLQAQKLGKRVKWISVETDANDFQYHIAFLLGALHQKADEKIEFAVLSDNEKFDSLVDFVNDAGRNCIRVKTKKKKKKINNNLAPKENLEVEYLSNGKDESVTETYNSSENV